VTGRASSLTQKTCRFSRRRSARVPGFLLRTTSDTFVQARECASFDRGRSLRKPEPGWDRSEDPVA